MIHLRKLRLTFTLGRFASHFFLRSSENLVGSIAQNPRLYRADRAVPPAYCEDLEAALTAVGLTIKQALKEAEAALLEYLHNTRSIQYLDADNMSRNSPYFLEELMKKVTIEENIRLSVYRYLCYHPINEFEPFFESMGLKPSEYASLLPKNMIFLSDDQLLLGNYHTLCNYGIPRNKMGRIYVEATQAFRYDYGVLPSKLQAYERLGLCHSTLLKVIASSPYLLIGDCNPDFVKVIGKFRHYVNDINWIEGHLLDGTSCNWSQMLRVMCFFGRVLTEQQLSDMINQHPDFFFDGSGGSRTLSLIVFLLKFGLSVDVISFIFVNFPPIKVSKFLSNLRHCLLILSELDMEAAEIGKIFHSHSLMLGSFTLRRTNSLLCNLKAGKKRLRMLIQDNPLELKNWELGIRVKPLPGHNEATISRLRKTEFLLSLGYDKDSKEMEEAFKVFRGKGAELQERFDCIVRAGLDPQDVQEMVKISPQILNLRATAINRKIDYLVNELGYPISSLVNFPSFLNYRTDRAQLRVSLYKWLVEQGCADPNLSLSTVVSTSEEVFVQQYVNRHPSGPQVWQDLKDKIFSQK
ncbi:transcription termination factor MTEF18, mitochondrial-like [Prosopis cineraria]|uniref:transcription termination factor MTEF18, mitochondrial-like n=1 Tax=Prosopis cineraria TaxID=364024 RepID=UPI00240EFE2E|nr:transcription termination factor MTEF18, mitochondrial-like [Prosopis cineraria]XP_054801561.1 transcription termination factor MTEF18, mitochondrial-like [Prosopis cineraria]